MYLPRSASRPADVRCRIFDFGMSRVACSGAQGYLLSPCRVRPQLVRRWRLGSLAPARAGALHCHHHSVRTLAAGPCETLVSGDAAGGLAMWTV